MILYITVHRKDDGASLKLVDRRSRLFLSLIASVILKELRIKAILKKALIKK